MNLDYFKPGAFYLTHYPPYVLLLHLGVKEYCST